MFFEEENEHKCAQQGVHINASILFLTTVTLADRPSL